MILNIKNQCECINGYILKSDGLSCRFICQDGYIYNEKTDSCDLIPVPSCQTGYTYNSTSKQC